MFPELLPAFDVVLVGLAGSALTDRRLDRQAVVTVLSGKRSIFGCLYWWYMKRIGLTGNIGSGKTTVCKVFEMLDIPVYDADKEARKFLNRADVVAKLRKLFGGEILDAEGKPDRKALAGLVFQNPGELKKLNALIHPLVRQDYEAWAAKQTHAPYTIQESAILFESDQYKVFDKTILVMAPRQVRIERVCKRDGVTVRSVEDRMKNQADQQELQSLADLVIHNDGKLLVIPQILRIHHELGGEHFQ